MGNMSHVVKEWIDSVETALCEAEKAIEDEIEKIEDNVEEVLQKEPFEFPRWNKDGKRVRMTTVKKMLEEKKFRVGDCIFLFGKGLVSRGPEGFQECNVAHVVQIWEVDGDEVTTIESTIDSEGKHIVNGVQNHDLQHCLDGHDIAWLVRLNEDMYKALHEVIDEEGTTRLDVMLKWERSKIGKARYAIADAVTSVFDGWPGLELLFDANMILHELFGQSEWRFFCSGIIAAAYVHAGILRTENSEFQWNLCTPKEFLKLQIWEPVIFQLKGYIKNEGDERLPKMPISCDDFLSLTPDQWNNNPE